MEIREVAPSEIGKFDELALSCGSLLNTSGWLDSFQGRALPRGIYDNNQLVGGFAIYKERKLLFDVYRNPPFTAEVGPFLRTEASNPVTIMGFYKQAITAMADFLDRLPYSVISLHLSRGVRDTQPFTWRGFRVNVGYTYILDLRQSLEALWQNMSHARRNDITKAAKEGFAVKKIEDLRILRDLVLKISARNKKQINVSCLDNVLFHFANTGNSLTFITYCQDKPAAGIFLIFNKGVARTIFSGYDYAFKHRGAKSLSYWESIKVMKGLGLESLDFGGSMNPVFERHLREFGGSLAPYYVINKARMPLEILLKFYKREFF